jgi:membrane protein implicated in regulation of membrane protease activity
MRLPEHDGRPGILLWVAAAVSVLLPIAGVGTALFGLYTEVRGDVAGWYWVAAGVGLIVVDMALDKFWASPRIAASDEPDLNRRGAELVGQTAIVVEPILKGGRGTVRAGDSIWVAEGCEAAAGACVRVTGVKGTALIVEAI